MHELSVQCTAEQRIRNSVSANVCMHMLQSEKMMWVNALVLMSTVAVGAFTDGAGTSPNSPFVEWAPRSRGSPCVTADDCEMLGDCIPGSGICQCYPGFTGTSCDQVSAQTVIA